MLWTLVRLGYVFLRMGEISQAQSIFIDCQKQFLEGDEFAGVIYSVEGLASLSIAQGNAEKAALLFSWADEMRLTLDDVRPPVEQMDVDKDIFIIRDVLGEKIYSKAITEGKTMTVERVSTIILEGENP